MKWFWKKPDLLFLLLLFLLCIPLERQETLSLLESQTISFRHALRSMVRGTAEFSQDDIVLVTIDEPFFTSYGKYPLTRNDLATVIENIHELGARVICVDLFLGLPGAYGEDDRLALVLKKSRSILASEGVFDEKGRFGELHYPAQKFQAVTQSGYVNLISPTTAHTFLSRLRIYPEIALLPDGWPISVQVLARYLEEEPRLEEGNLKIGDRSIPMDSFNDIHIDFSPLPEGYTFLHQVAGISAYEFLDIADLLPEEHQELAHWVKGKMVFIGETLPASNDWFDTPVGMIYGVEIIADTVNTLLKQAPLRPAPGWAEILISFLLLGSLVLVTNILKRPILQIPTAFFIFCLYLAVCIFFYVRWGVIFSMTHNLVIGLVGFFVLSLSSYMRDRRMNITQRELAETRLRKAHDELEIRVEQRTRELSRTNEQLTSEIQERKRAEVELQKAKKASEDANQAKTDFVSNMSHEIRTPMNAIIGFSEIALQQEMPAKLRDYLSKISASSQNLLGIINDILDFAKIEAGKLELEITDFHLEDVVGGVGDLLGDMANEKGLELITFIKPGTPCALRGDPLRLGQVLTNLVSNAIKFTQQGQVFVRVSSQPATRGRTLFHFSVEDTGIGINPQQAEALFDSFTQADTSTSRKYGGSGLGLSICMNIIQQMGGNIKAEGREGRGSIFSFTVPLEKRPREMETDFSLPKKLRDMRVIVVDDNEIARDVARSMLESFGFETRCASSGEQALEIITKAAAKKPFDLMITDWKMSGMDGIELSQNVLKLARPGSPPPRIIMMTAFGRERVGEQAREAGLDAFLFKPLKPRIFYNAICEVFGEDAKTVPFSLGSSLGKAGISKALNGKRVLLVEDSAFNQQVAQELLEDAGIRVDIAQNGKEAVEMVRPALYDLVLMDIQMPMMDGCQATRRLRENRDLAELPIVAMTAHALEEEKKRCLDAGMNDFITKPIDRTHLFVVLANWLVPDKPVTRGEAPAPEKGESVEALPQELPGLDIAAGLRGVGGDLAFFIKTLSRFRSIYADWVQQYQETLDQGDQEGMERLAHTLKGSAGQVGAARLRKKAFALEKAVKDGHLDQAPEILEQLDDALQEIFSSIQKAVGHFKGEQIMEPTLEPALAPSLEKAGEMLSELLKMLYGGDAQALDRMDSVKGAVLNGQTTPLFEKARKQVENFDFELAAQTLSRFAEENNIPLTKDGS